jgi:hypothetical protein
MLTNNNNNSIKRADKENLIFQLNALSYRTAGAKR